MTVRFHDSAHPLFQTTDTFQQLIQDLNHFGDIHDSDMKYLDSAIGPGGTLSLNGLSDFTANTIVDALNELDSDLHGVGGGNAKADLTTAAKAVVDAINEIDAVFDASAKKINTTGDFTIDIEAGDIILDAGGADVIFKDDSVQYAALTNNSGAVIFKNASSEVFRGDSSDIVIKRAVQLPTSGTGTPVTSTKTLHGALSDINSRIPNVYDRSGTLLNPLP